MFTFVEQIDGVEFKDALKILADKAGVQLRSYDPRERSEKARLYEVCEKAAQFFERQLSSSTLGREAKAYLTDRGITDASIGTFRIGLAPQTRNSLSEFLQGQGYSPNEIFKSGVSIQQSAYSPSDVSGQVSAVANIDRFRGRIMFPIFDLNSQVIGFGGRVFFAKNQVPDPHLAKYINTPQTLLYDKSRTLYGLDKAKLKIRERECCMLVEGYTDVIMAHQAGDQNAAAVSGTALTEQQLDILRRYTENLIILFDMDTAGDTATKRGISMAHRKGFEIRVVTLPEGKDPAEIIQKNERKWKQAVEKPLSIGEFYFQNAFAKFDSSTPEGIRGIQRAVLPVIRQIPSQIEQSFWVQKLAQKFSCAETLIWRELEKLPEPASVPSSGSDLPRKEPGVASAHMPKISEKKTKQDIVYERMLLVAHRDPETLAILTKKNLGLFSKLSIPARAVLKLKHRKPFTPEEGAALEAILFQEEIFPSLAAETVHADEFRLCLQTLKQRALRDQLFRLQRELKSDQKNDELLKKFQAVSMRLAKL